jgi:hypothetical protein
MQFQKGQSGNPAGRPPGSFRPASILVAGLREGEAEKIVRATIEKAINGDSGALRICWQRLDPLPRHDRMAFELPQLTGSNEIGRVVAGILRAVAGGKLSAGEGAQLAKVLDPLVRSFGLVLSDFDEVPRASQDPSQPGVAEMSPPTSPDIPLILRSMVDNTGVGHASVVEPVSTSGCKAPSRPLAHPGRSQTADQQEQANQSGKDRQHTDATHDARLADT